MTVRFVFDCNALTTAMLEALFAAANLGGRHGDKIRRAFANSTQVCLAYDADQLVGACRAISDGEYHAFIYDVAVLPAYQGQGIGKRMLAQLLALLPVWRVMLIADQAVQGFYRQHGFTPYDDAMARIDITHLYDAPPARLGN